MFAMCHAAFAWTEEWLHRPAGNISQLSLLLQRPTHGILGGVLNMVLSKLDRWLGASPAFFYALFEPASFSLGASPDFFYALFEPASFSRIQLHSSWLFWHSHTTFWQALQAILGTSKWTDILDLDPGRITIVCNRATGNHRAACHILGLILIWRYTRPALSPCSSSMKPLPTMGRSQGSRNDTVSPIHATRRPRTSH